MLRNQAEVGNLTRLVKDVEAAYLITQHETKKELRLACLPLTLNLILSLTFTLTLETVRLQRVASEEATAETERVQYDLLHLVRKLDQKRQKLEKKLSEQEGNLARVDALRDKERSDMVVQTRARDKEVRALAIARVDVERQQQLIASQSVKLAHDKSVLRDNSKRISKRLASAKVVMAVEKNVSFLVFGNVYLVATRDSIIPLPF